MCDTFIGVFTCIQILPAWVKSIEDHGCIVDFGVEGKSGFLLRKNASEYLKLCNRGRTLCLGQVVQCLVLPGADARSVPVTINPSAVRSSVLSADAFVAIHSLLPGLLVNATVKEVRTCILFVHVFQNVSIL